MYIHELTYHSPKSLSELLDLLNEHGEDGKILAGGTDLILQMKLKKWKQKHIIDLKRVPGLNEQAYKGGVFVIGCNTTLTELLENRVLKHEYQALWEAVHELADVQIRNRGTLVGNICNASPAADASSPLMAFQAKVLIVSALGERELSLEDFFLGPGKTALRPNEMVRAIYLPKPAGRTYSSFQKLGRVYDDIALVNAAVRVQLDESFHCVSATVAMGAVGPTTLRAGRAEKFLTGNRLEERVIDEAASLAAADATPISDVRASAEYRKKMVEVLVRRALQDVLKKAGKAIH